MRIGRTFVVALAAVSTWGVAAPAAEAALTLAQTAEAIVVIGDDGPNRIQVQDGSVSGGDNYAFAFYSESGEPVDLGSSGCVSDGGSPVENIYCGTSSFNKAAFLLGGGADHVGSFNDPQFQVLGELGVDFGPGNDDNEGGAFYGIPTTFLGDEGDDTLAGQEGPSSVVEGGPGQDTLTGGGALSGETLRGGPGNDNINGLGGNDSIFGDEGDDTLVGGAEGDTITGGAGLDNVEGDGTVNAFSGNDTLLLADGERDAAICGLGADSVEADSVDLLPLGDCESVTIVGGPPPPPPPGGSAKVSLGKPGKLTRAKRRISLTVSCPASAAGGCAGSAVFALRFVEKGKQRKVSLGRARFDLDPGARKAVGRKVSARLFARLRRAKKRRLVVSVTSKDDAGRTFKSSRTSKLVLGR
jgi:RTX calcium-binding nonapeptide repeat (4 copies)